MGKHRIYPSAGEFVVPTSSSQTFSGACLVTGIQYSSDRIEIWVVDKPAGSGYIPVTDSNGEPVWQTASTVETAPPAWSSVTSKPTFATVATSGSYNDLTDKPSIPGSQVNSDWNSSSGVSQILNKPSLANVATTGAYADLTGKPTLGTAAAQNTSAFDAAGSAAAAQLASQPVDSDLTAIAALTTTSYGRSFLTQADAAAARAYIGAGTGSGTVTSVGLSSTDFSVSGSPVTTSGSITANLTATGVSAGEYDRVTVDTKGRVTAAGNPTINNNVARSLNSNYTISATRRARCYYSISCTWSLAALLSGNGSAFLEYSVDAGSNWITVNSVGKTLALLTFAGSDEMNLSGEVPLNAMTRIRTSSNNMTLSFVRGQEVLY